MGSSILKYAIVMIFMFSTVYTLSFYYNSSEGTPIGVDGLDEYDGTLKDTPQAQESFITTIVDNMLELVLEALSWFSPFVLVKGLLIVIVPSPIYEPLNLLILRPLGWIGTWITTEWIINKLRGGSET